MGEDPGGSTGSTSMIIQSGLMPDLLNASSTFRRLAIFLILVSLPVAASSVRSWSMSRPTSSFLSRSRTPSAPMAAEKSSPYSSTFAR